MGVIEDAKREYQECLERSKNSSDVTDVLCTEVAKSYFKGAEAQYLEDLREMSKANGELIELKGIMKRLSYIYTLVESELKGTIKEINELMGEGGKNNG